MYLLNVSILKTFLSRGSGIQVSSTLWLYHLLGPQGPLNSADGEVEGEESILAARLLHPGCALITSLLIPFTRTSHVVYVQARTAGGAAQARQPLLKQLYYGRGTMKS